MVKNSRASWALPGQLKNTNVFYLQQGIHLQKVVRMEKVMTKLMFSTVRNIQYGYSLQFKIYKFVQYFTNCCSVLISLIISLPNKYICKFPVIKTNCLQMHTVEMFIVIIRSSLILLCSNSDVAPINTPFNIGEASKSFAVEICCYFWSLSFQAILSPKDFLTALIA